MIPTDAVDAAIAADAEHADPAIWIARVPDHALRDRACVLEAEGRRDRPLWGMLVAIKDNIDVAGLPTTAGCPGFAYTPARNATCVQRLLDAGAIVMGKTNLDQFATGLVGVRSPYGVPRNVFDDSRVPGGSSSGSAVAVAAGIVPVALGTDTAGSGRVPAAFGNIVGLKPTIGSVSATGVVPACRSIDTVSVFARDVDQALAVARVIAGHDPKDPYSRAAPFDHLRCWAPPGTARVARIRADGIGREQAALYDAACGLYAAQMVDVAPFLAIARLLYDGPWVAERTAALREVVTHRPEILHPITRKILEGGLERRTVDAFDAFHSLANIRLEARRLFAQYDVLLLPTTLPAPTLMEVAADPIGVNTTLGSWTNFVNLCDFAAIAVPAGFLADGRPVGVTVVGPAWSDGRIAAIADAIHRACAPSAGAARTPLPAPAAADLPGSDEVALFCVGGHMSGLALNHQITSLGGRLLRPAHTAPVYRLYALGARPGLVRHVQGAAIAGEVWVLPTASVGALLVQIPAPLGFGTVTLTDGPCLGFLAEAAATKDAHDITGHGGWRAWLASGEAPPT